MSGKVLPVVAYEREKHEPALYRFVEKVLGVEKSERRRHVIDTMHTSMPGHDRLPLRYVIMDGERVAGSMGHMPADFWVNGKRIEARFTHDLLVDPDYRGGGLAKLLVDNARQQGDFFPGGMWMTQPCHQIHVRCGFDEATPLSTYSLVLDPGTFAARKGLSFLKALAARIGLGVNRVLALTRARREVAGAQLLETRRFEPATDATWSKLAAGYGVTRVRDAAYLNWKYADHPTLAYRNLLVKRGGETTGYLIWRLAPPGADEKRAVVADFLVAKGDAVAFRQLMARVIVDANSAGMESVSVLTTQLWAASALRKLGFLPRGTRNTWVVANWHPHMPAEWLRDLEAWHVCLGDSDGDIWTGSQ